MDLVWITATSDVFRQLQDIDELVLVRASTRELEGGEAEISGYASPAAAAAARALGAEVEVVQSEADVQPYLDQVAEATQEAISETGEA